MEGPSHSNELLEAVLQGIGTGVVLIDSDGKCLLSNSTANQLLGNIQLQDASLSKRNKAAGFFYVDKVTPLPEFDNPYAKAMRGEFIEKEEIYLRNTAMPFGGWCSFNIRPFRLSEAKISGGVILIENVTEQRKLADEVIRSNRDLQQFAYVAAHDLQEPLRTVTGFGELLSKSMAEVENEKALDHLKRILAASRRMQTLIAALLSYARIETHAKAPVECNTKAIVNNVIADMGKTIKDSDAEVLVGELPVVLADDSQLSQVFNNVLSNALKYSKDKPLITINAVSDEYFHHFCIADNGIGIEQQFVDRVFVIFQRLHNKAQYEGVGIGLALCKKIIENHGGRIWAVPKSGGGTEIHFTLPIVAKGGE